MNQIVRRPCHHHRRGNHHRLSDVLCRLSGTGFARIGYADHHSGGPGADVSDLRQPGMSARRFAAAIYFGLTTAEKAEARQRLPKTRCDPAWAIGPRIMRLVQVGRLGHLAKNKKYVPGRK